MFDTGATRNYMAKTLAKELQLVERPENKKVELANGQVHEVQSSVSTKIRFAQIPEVDYKIDAFILEVMKEDVVIGLEFMEENDFALDLR